MRLREGEALTLAQRLRAFGSPTQFSMDSEIARVNARLREVRFDWRAYFEARKQGARRQEGGR